MLEEKHNLDGITVWISLVLVTELNWHCYQEPSTIAGYKCRSPYLLHTEVKMKHSFLNILWLVLYHHSNTRFEAHNYSAHFRPAQSEFRKSSNLTFLSVVQRQRMPFHLQPSWGAKLNQLLCILSNSDGSSEEAAWRISSESVRDIAKLSSSVFKHSSTAQFLNTRRLHCQDILPAWWSIASVVHWPITR